MAMEGMGGEMGKLSGEMEDDTVTDQNQKDTKPKTDTNTKPEDLDGLQMLRLPPQEDDKTLLRKDILPTPDEPTDQPTLVHQQAAADDDFKHKDDLPSEEPKVEEDADYDEKLDLQIRSSQKHKGVEEAVKKPALVKKEVSELHGLLTERQQKILQDFHVKFVLEGGVNVEEDDDESRARKHSEFVELKKRLEEEEKMYAGCALGEASDITDAVDKDDSSTPADVAVRAAMDGVINSLAEVAICRRDSTSPPQEDVKPQPSRPRNDVRNQAMKGLADDDDDDNDELQEYTNREGSVTCQCCCRKAGKQIDEGDESNVYMTHSSYSVLNVVCPVSGMPVVDLEDPVRSEECEHIYDRASALNYIASMAKDGFCLCASPGCRVLLAENKLVTDSRLWQDIEELRQIKAAMWESRMLQDYVNIDDSDDD